MIITKTPFRISFAGGGTDFADFYEKEVGAVVSTTIDKYVHIAIHRSFEPHYLLKYSKTEKVTDINQIEHPLIRQCLLRFSDVHPQSNEIAQGVSQPFLELTSFADVPSSGSGLGSSSAFTVGLIKALFTLNHKIPDNEEIARIASDIEINDLHEPIGKQDQYACAVGGFNLIEFHPGGHVQITPLIISHEFVRALEDHFLLFYTGITRSAKTILSEQKKNTSQTDKFKSLQKMKSLAYDFAEALQQSNLDKIGELLHQGWQYKKTLSSTISSPDLDSYYDLALKNGAVGGKILGAGGGGFFLFFCKPENHAKLKKALPLRHVPFRFDFQGTRIIHIENED